MSHWDTFDLDRPGPKYLSVYRSIAEAIDEGRLPPGRRLPSHRLLADRLGLSVGTVTRAYTKALDDGLIAGEIGRGTFVRQHRPAPLQVVDESRIPAGSLDLYQNFPVPVPDEDAIWVETLAELQRRGDLANLVRASWSEMSVRDQRAGADWIGRLGLAAPRRRILNLPGVQAAMTAIVAAVTRPGDTLATSALSHPGIRLLAEHLGLRVRALPFDDEGILPDAFDEACSESAPRLLYVAPTIHSPTAVTLSDERRRAIAAVAERHDVWIAEDESAAFLLPEPLTPLAAFAPERTFFLGDVWMALSLGLRTTYVLAPESMLGPLDTAVAATSGLTTPLIAEIAARWIGSETADALIDARRAELLERHAIVTERLGRRTPRAVPYAHHIWLELPAPWTSDGFTLAAERRGIAVNSAQWFAMGHGVVPAAVRICIGTPRDRGHLRWALEALDRLIDEPGIRSRPVL